MTKFEVNPINQVSVLLLVVPVLPASCNFKSFNFFPVPLWTAPSNIEVIWYAVSSLKTCLWLFLIVGKLSLSAEKWDKAIRPDVARQYSDIPNSKLYFKFVGQDDKDLEEVVQAKDEYAKAGVNADIYLMPVGATLEGQEKTSRQVADICLQYGYKFSPRLHVDLFGNKWGT